MSRYRIGDEELDEIEQKIVADVEAYGWHVAYVLGDEDAAPFAYTIGVHQSYGHPELSLFGLEFEDSHAVLIELVERVQRGERLDVSREYDELFEDGICTFRAVDPFWYESFFGRGIDFYGTLDFPMLQCIWSDDAGRFPWDTGFAPELDGLQPNLTTAPATG